MQLFHWLTFHQEQNLTEIKNVKTSWRRRNAVEKNKMRHTLNITKEHICIRWASRKKSLSKKKKLKFRKTFESFTTQMTSLWRFARWAKNKSHLSKKIFKISDLIQKKSKRSIIKKAIEFENKINMLFTQFFSSTEQTDLSDTLKYWYSNVVVKTHEDIIENEICQKIKKCKFDNISRSNDISN